MTVARAFVASVGSLLLLGACSREPVAPVGPVAPAMSVESVARLFHTPRASFGASSSTYSVQGITTRNGQFWGGCTGSSWENVGYVHDIPGGGTHSDTITYYFLNASCQNNSYAYNGGWIEVHETTGGDTYIDSVDGNLVTVDFNYPGSPISIKLVGRPDVTSGCLWGGFDGYDPTITEITVPGTGSLPLAHFDC